MLDEKHLFREVDYGRFDEATQLLPTLKSSSSVVDHAFALRIEASMWLAGLRGSFPAPEEADPLVDSDEARGSLLHLSSLGALASVLRFDDDELDRWLAVGRRLGGSDEHRLAMTQCWPKILNGGDAELAGRLQEAAKTARSLSDATSVVMASAQSAINSLSLGDIGAATEAARRASRMASTESLPQVEYLSHLVLARVRRSAGSPHLALHILRRLGAAAPGPWQRWIQLERGLAGDRSKPAEGPALALWELRSAAQSGDRDAFDAAVESLGRHLGGFGLLAAEVRGLIEMIDPQAPVGPASPAAEWVHGVSAEVPQGLHAFGAAQDGTISCVAVGADGGGRRLMQLGRELLSPDTREIPRGERPRIRTDTAIACLALAAARTLRETELFATLYGTEYDDGHKPALDALIHRMREALGDRAEVTRAKGKLSLELAQPIVALDPRCEEPLEDRVLRALASGPTTARDVSATLSVSLRSVQDVLAALIEVGACVKRRQGRAIEYRVEDTTFSEPTRV